MVRLFFSFLLLIAFTTSVVADTQSKNLLDEKIKELVDAKVYNKNRAYIKTRFAKKSKYYKQDRVNVMRVVSTLKANGLLKLRFKKPQELILSFKTTGHPMFFVKIMGDTLRNIGYYRYVTTSSSLNNEEFTWTIGLTTEYATDPLVLQRELKKSACKIVDVKRVAATEWEYTIDTSRASLNVIKLRRAQEVKLKRSLYAHWLNVSNIKKLAIVSGERNSWYPHVVYYDSSLHILKVIKKDKKTQEVTFSIPKNAKYMKISDIYTMKNMKDDLVLNPMGYR
jgi:hypothetical protein